MPLDEASWPAARCSAFGLGAIQPGLPDIEILGIKEMVARTWRRPGLLPAHDDPRRDAGIRAALADMCDAVPEPA